MPVSAGGRALHWPGEKGMSVIKGVWAVHWLYEEPVLGGKLNERNVEEYFSEESAVWTSGADAAGHDIFCGMGFPKQRSG